MVFQCIRCLLVPYPNAILTLDSAFYYHGLTDVISDKYILNTGRNASKIRNKKIKQYFCSEDLLDIGKTQMDHQGVDIRIYDLERLMIELIKYRSKLPYDYYKEIVRSYRERVYDIDTEHYRRGDFLMNINEQIDRIILTSRDFET